MPSGLYTFTVYNISGSLNGTFTLLSSFEVTVSDPDDNFGVGDDQINLSDGGGSTETGAAPVIQSLGQGAPAGWNVGDTFYFGGARGADQDDSDDYLIPKVGGTWSFQTTVWHPDASIQPVIGQTYTRTSTDDVLEEILPPVCFTRGTLIETDQGKVAIESLKIGNLVVTKDHGLQPVRWIGSRVLSCDMLSQVEKLRPIRILRHALGANTPSSDLLVSPQHRVLVRSQIAQRMFGADEVLVAAKQLCQIDGIDIAMDVMEVEYFHILFDRHEIVTSNGAETESLFTGPEALKSVGTAAREEIFALFPELKDRDYTPAVTARTFAASRMARKLAVRHQKNQKPLVS